MASSWDKDEDWGKAGGIHDEILTALIFILCTVVLIAQYRSEWIVAIRNFIINS